jgi:hypothetical protein
MVLSKRTGGRVGCTGSSADGAFRFADGAARGRGAVLSSLLAAVSAVALSAGTTLAADDAAPKSTGEQAAMQALMAKIQSMEQRIHGLETELKDAKANGSRAAGMAQSASTASKLPADAKPFADTKDDRPKFLQAADLKTPMPDKGKGLFGVVESPIPQLSIGMYGELKFGTMQNPAAGGQWQNGFDAARLVLLPTYQVTDNIIFNAEIEFEHSGSGFDNDDKLHGTAEIEQAFFDFKFNDTFNWRAPGIDLVPVGFTNMYHEPTLFYSVNRPELANGLVPTTWRVPATAIYGKLAEGLTYELQVSQGLEDFGDAFTARTGAGTVPPVGTPYTAGIDGVNALGFSRPPLGSFAQLNNAVAVSGRLAYSPSFLPGFSGSSSFYYSPNVTPRGAHADDGTLLGNNSVLLFDTEFRYRVPDTGLELRGEFVHVSFSNPENLRANNDGDPTNNVGKYMYGVSGEIAYHFKLGTIMNTEWEAVPFYRYTYQNLQTGGFAGTDTDMPIGLGQQQFHTVGVAVFPTPKVVLKATYQKVINNDPAGANSDSVLGAVGWLF